MSALTTSRPHQLPQVSVSIPPTPSVSSPLPESTDRLIASSLSASPDSCYAPLPSLSNSSASSSSSSLVSIPERPNEHLAILLPRNLWKPDSLASRCDNFYCPVRFSVFERKHHCRKCGGIFCHSCTVRTTPLLDISNLSFLHPPHNVRLSTFESPTSPILDGRVCDDCWDQIHGNPSTPHTPDLIRPSFSRLLSSPISMLKSPLFSSPATSGNSSLSSSIEVPSQVHHRLAASETLLATAVPLARRSRSLMTATSVSSLDGVRRTHARTAHLPPLAEPEKRSYGELDAYPLRRSSIVCKATGGGRWEPKQDPPIIGYRPPVPGGKAQHELEIERLEREEKIRRQNPVIRDGEFQYRFQRPREPVVVARIPLSMSTF